MEIFNQPAHFIPFTWSNNGLTFYTKKGNPDLIGAEAKNLIFF